MTPHVLFVSWWFPPLRGGGVYRPLNFVTYLREQGFRVSVLTAAPAGRHGTDDSLLDRIPHDVRVIRCPHFDPFELYGKLRRMLPRRSRVQESEGEPIPSSAQATKRAGLSDWISERFSLPDRWITWVGPAARAAQRALRDDPPDLICSSSPPHSMHLVSTRLKNYFDCPLVLDFRDPWVTNPFRGFSLPTLARKDEQLERRALEAADQVVANTPALERRFRDRHPWLENLRTITNGFAPALLESVGPREARGEGPMELLHVGHLYGARSGRYLVQGLELLKARVPDLADRLRVRLVGAIEQQDAYLADARARGVDDVLDTPGVLSHDEALAVQRRADALLILGVEEPGLEVQVPGKLYEYFVARRPVLTLSRKGGAIQEVLDLARFPYELGEPDDPADIADALERFSSRFAGGDLEHFDDERIAQFRYDRLTDRLRECFEEALELSIPHFAEGARRPSSASAP